MQTQCRSGTDNYNDSKLDDELADVLVAISVISKRLAKKLTQLSLQEQQNTKGETRHEHDK